MQSRGQSIQLTLCITTAQKFGHSMVKSLFHCGVESQAKELANTGGKRQDIRLDTESGVGQTSLLDTETGLEATPTGLGNPTCGQ